MYIKIVKLFRSAGSNGGQSYLLMRYLTFALPWLSTEFMFQKTSILQFGNWRMICHATERFILNNIINLALLVKKKKLSHSAKYFVKFEQENELFYSMNIIDSLS